VKKPVGQYLYFNALEALPRNEAKEVMPLEHLVQENTVEKTSERKAQDRTGPKNSHACPPPELSHQDHKPASSGGEGIVILWKRNFPFQELGCGPFFVLHVLEREGLNMLVHPLRHTLLFAQ
jgi:hypothetical protein